ncbi:MAG TPA: ATP synthase F1 subunit delta [Candidatus Angelobacter sp.]|nr:ATP synthase F1 subunit delta [Candidatus Angelobacter sp.]
MGAAAGRYARAFAEVVADHKMDPEKTVAELTQMADLVSSSHELHNVLLNPAVEHEQKIGLLDAIIKKMGGSKLLRNLVAVLIDHKRIGQIGEIAEQFRQELNARMGIAEARVSSARALTATEKKSLEQRLAAVTGKTVRATYSEDADLLGGAVVRIGSTVYDGSVRGQLQRLKQEIAGS